MIWSRAVLLVLAYPKQSRSDASRTKSASMISIPSSPVVAGGMQIATIIVILRDYACVATCLRIIILVSNGGKWPSFSR